MRSGGWARIVGAAAALGGLVVGGVACGGGDEPPALMPAVQGLRLDVALSDLAAQGVAEEDVEVVGGGTLGVLDESNWDVCEQRPQAGTPIESVRLIVDRFCDDANSDSAAAPEEESASGTDANGGTAAEQDTTSSPAVDEADGSGAVGQETLSPAEFANSAAGDIADMRKDLSDSVEALADGGVFRLNANLLELTFNYGQLDALDAPKPVRADWKAAMGRLDGALDTYAASLEGDSLDGVGQALVDVDAALTELSAVVQSAA